MQLYVHRTVEVRDRDNGNSLVCMIERPQAPSKQWRTHVASQDVSAATRGELLTAIEKAIAAAERKARDDRHILGRGMKKERGSKVRAWDRHHNVD